MKKCEQTRFLVVKLIHYFKKLNSLMCFLFFLFLSSDVNKINTNKKVIYISENRKHWTFEAIC